MLSQGRPTLETKHADPRSGTAKSAAAVASTAAAERIHAVYACLDVAACRVPMIGQPFDLPTYDWSSIQLTLVIVYFLRSESIGNLRKA